MRHVCVGLDAWGLEVGLGASMGAALRQRARPLGFLERFLENNVVIIIRYTLTGTQSPHTGLYRLAPRLTFSRFRPRAPGAPARARRDPCVCLELSSYSPGYHPCSALGFTLPSRTPVREHAPKSPLVPALARASTPPVRPLLLQSAQVKGCLGVAGVLEPRGPT